MTWQPKYGYVIVWALIGLALGMLTLYGAKGEGVEMGKMKYVVLILFTVLGGFAGTIDYKDHKK